MPDSLNPVAPDAAAVPPAAAVAGGEGRSLRSTAPAIVLAFLLAALLPAAAAFIGWQMQGSTGGLAALHLSAQLRVTAENLEQQARSALREAPGEAPMPAWYAEELRRQAPGYSRLIDAMAANELPPGLTGEARTLHLRVDDAARRRIEASAATWLDVRNQIEPALRPGSPDAALRKAAVTLEALGPMMVESSADLARALHADSRGDWQRLARAQWLLALAIGLSAALLVARALLRRARVD